LIVAVTGLGREARVIARPDIITVVGGGNGHALELQVQTALKEGARRVLSIGICGALSPSLKVGDCIVATEIVTDGTRLATDRPWTNELLERVPAARLGVLAGSDAIVADKEAKSRLHSATNAAAVDMESHIAARVAHEHGLPFAAVRIVSDSYRQSLPPAALVGMSSTGKVDVLAVLLSLVGKPAQIPSLIRTAWEAEKAFRTLFRYRHVLNPIADVGLIPADLGELSLDVG
jgi:hopanoid-associated phosphorylase